MVEKSSTSHFGVMGAVARPGVYADETATPLLVDVVGRAGGLTDRATGNVRIVRGERAGQQTFYTPGLDFRLQRGDLVVVDSRPSARSRHRSEAAGLAPPAETDGIQLAFLHVLDRPVVLKMRASDASIARILQLLRQPGDIASTVRVVETGPAYTRGRRDEMTRLADGSVLVFDGDRVDRGQLPSFPPVFEKPAAPAAPVTIPRTTEAPANIVPESPLPVTGAKPQPFRDNPVGAVSIARPMRSGVPSTIASMTRRSMPIPSASDPLLPPVPRPQSIDEPSESPERPLLAGPMIKPEADSEPQPKPMRTAAAIPETADAAEAADSEVPSLSFLDEPSPTGDVEIADDRAAIADDRESSPSVRPERTAGGGDTGSLVIVLTVLVAAAGLIWLLGRRTENVGSIHLEEAAVERRPDAVPTTSTEGTRQRLDTGHSARPVPAAHVPLSRPSSLDDLIEGRVTFQEEPLSLPNSLELFGKSTTEVWHRLDTADSANPSNGTDPEPTAKSRRPRRPHIAERLARSVASQDADTAGTEHDLIPETGGASSGLVLDRVLTAVHGGSR